MAELWYYAHDGKQMDAVPMKELQRLASDGVLKPTDMLWKEGMPRWVRANSLAELSFSAPTGALHRNINGPNYSPAVSENELAAASSERSASVPSPAEERTPSVQKRRRFEESAENRHCCSIDD